MKNDINCNQTKYMRFFIIGYLSNTSFQLQAFLLYIFFSLAAAPLIKFRNVRVVISSGLLATSSFFAAFKAVLFKLTLSFFNSTLTLINIAINIKTLSFVSLLIRVATFYFLFKYLNNTPIF